MGNTEWKTDRTWIEVNIRHLRHNVQELTKAMPPHCKLMAVVKTGAYGHGAAEISSHLNQMGVTAFAAAVIEEGTQLRESGIRGEILILGHTDARRVPQLVRYDLIQTVIDLDYARELNRQGQPLNVHIKIDTGMHRMGIPAEDVSGVREVFAMEHLHVCGMYTHLCCADSRKADDISFTKKQTASFYSLADALKKSGITLPKLHIQSSYGLLNYPELSCDYVRAGIALYGVLSSAQDETKLKLDLQPVLSLKSRIVLIRLVKKGSSIGYGRSFTASRDSRIAILPAGYGDGYPRSLSGRKADVSIRKHRVPVIGRICMDQLAVDITDVPDAAVGDTAVLIGTKEEGATAPETAGEAGSISNELLSRMGARLPIVVTYE